MNIKPISLKDLEEGKRIEIGFEGENNRTQLAIDCREMFEEYPDAIAAISVVPPAGAPYPATITENDGIVSWTIRDSDLTKRGNGEFQLTFVEDATIAKTYIGKIHIKRSIHATGTAPDPIADWMVEASTELTDLEQKKASGYFKGDKGDPGEPGDPTELIDDTTPGSDKTFSSAKVDEELTSVKTDIQGLGLTVADGKLCITVEDNNE